MFTSGFFNSLNGDRKYDTEQISSLFDGIIADGVFANVGEQFAVVPGSGMDVIVKTGRAWFNHTWSLNDTWMRLTVDAPDPLRPRIDSVVLEVDSTPLVRSNSIKIIKGAPASTPVAPEMMHTYEVNQYRLADITVKVGATTITADEISIKVGLSETPFVISPVKSIDVSYLFNDWNNEFNTWFENIKEQLSGDVASNLQKQVNERVKIADKATIDDISNKIPDKWVDAEALSSVVPGSNIGDLIFSTEDLETKSNGKYLRADGRAISKLDYPELCESRLVKHSVLNIMDSSVNNSIKWVYNGTNVSSGYNEAGNYMFNTNMHNGYIYKIYLGNESGQVAHTVVVKRALADFSSGIITFDDFCTFATESMIISVEYCAIYITDAYLYFLPYKGTRWHKVDLVTGFVQTLTGAGITYFPTTRDNVYPSFMYWQMTNSGEIIIQYAHISSDSTVYLNLITVTYTPDLSSRTYLAHSSAAIGSNYGYYICNTNNLKPSFPKPSGVPFCCYDDELYIFNINVNLSSTSGASPVVVYKANNIITSLSQSGRYKTYTLAEFGLVGAPFSSGTLPGHIEDVIVNDSYIYICLTFNTVMYITALNRSSLDVVATYNTELTYRLSSALGKYRPVVSNDRTCMYIKMTDSNQDYLGRIIKIKFDGTIKPETVIDFTKYSDELEGVGYPRSDESSDGLIKLSVPAFLTDFGYRKYNIPSSLYVYISYYYDDRFVVERGENRTDTSTNKVVDMPGYSATTIMGHYRLAVSSIVTTNYNVDDNYRILPCIDYAYIKAKN